MSDRSSKLLLVSLFILVVVVLALPYFVKDHNTKTVVFATAAIAGVLVLFMTYFRKHKQ